jgi:hypothetical protein
MDVKDAPLLDYGFQPLVNWSWQHPIDLALMTAMGGAVMLSASAIIVLLTSGFMIGFILNCLGVAAQIVAITMIYRGQHTMRTLLKPGMRNPMRILLFPIRIMMLLSLLFLCLVMMLVTGPVVSSLLYTMGITCWISTYYFQSCDLPPAKPQRTPIAALERPI